MAVPKSASEPVAATHAALDSVPDARHIWLPSERSLCDLAVRRRVSTRGQARVGNAAAREFPACEACILIAGMLGESAKRLTAERPDTTPSREQAMKLLGTTTWPWVASNLLQQ
jgi:hypothetical protein